MVIDCDSIFGFVGASFALKKHIHVGGLHDLHRLCNLLPHDFSLTIVPA